MARLLLMPSVAANAVEAVLADWPVPVGDAFGAGDALATVETEKAVVDVPADGPGVLVRTLVTIGTEVRVGEPIALLGDPDEVVDDPEAVLARLGARQGPDDSGADEPGVDEPGMVEPGMVEPGMVEPGVVEPGVDGARAGDVGAGDGLRVPAPVVTGPANLRIFSSPLARRLAKEAGLGLDDLVGTGPGGRIVRRDVERGREARDRRVEAPVVSATDASVDGSASSAAPARSPGSGDQGYVDVPHTRMRRAIAERLGRSVREAPHFAVHGTARVERLLELRVRLNGYGGPKISVNDLVVLAAARAHAQVPAMNVTWLPDAVRQYAGVDVAVAVSTDRGLVTPVLRGLDRMSISAVAAASAELVCRARAGRLREDELVGGTLTVTNLGPYGTEAFTAIINPPQSAILAVGAAREEAVVRDGKLEVGTVMHVTLAVDHRPVDGAVAAEWMAAFLALVEEPVRILA